MDDVIPYVVGASEKVQGYETELKADLTELKNEVEENEVAHGISRVVRCGHSLKCQKFFNCAISRSIFAILWQLKRYEPQHMYELC